MAIAVILMGRTEMPAAEYAKAACGDLSRLMQHESPSEVQTSEALTYAAARADRAATVDGSFTNLDKDLDRIRDAVGQTHSLSQDEAKSANAAIAAVVKACTDLGVTVQTQRTGLSALTVDDLRQPEGP